MNQRGHGNKQDTFLFLFRAVFTELDRTEVFLIYIQLCMDLVMTIKGEFSIRGFMNLQ